jgi:hypothetical protein
MTRLLGACAAALLFAAGCGDDGGEDQIDSAAEFCTELVDAWAAKMVDCYGATLDAARREVGQEVPCARIEEAAAAGHIGFDRAVAEQCLAALEAYTCFEIQRTVGGPPEECADAVPAQVEEGGTCFTDTPIECIGGYCEFDACNAPGLCVTAALEGELCQTEPDYRRCAEGLDCAWTGTDNRCVEPVPPTISGLDEACGSGQICAEGLYCAWTGMEYLCKAQGTGACDSWDACLLGYRCIDGACATIKGLGEACTTGTGECLYGAFCADPDLDTAGVCAAWPGAGGECGYLGYEEVADCIESWCESETNGMALAPGPRPALVSPLAAMGPGTCRPYIGLGEWCGDASWDACGPAAFCNYGSCAKAYCLPR